MVASPAESSRGACDPTVTERRRPLPGRTYPPRDGAGRGAINGYDVARSTPRPAPRPAPGPGWGPVTQTATLPPPASARTSRTHPGAGVAMLMIVGGGFVTQLLTTITGILSARMLGVEGRGQIVLVASLAMMTSQLTLGGSLPNAITKQPPDRGVTARDGLHHLVPRWVLWSLLPSGIAGAYFLLVERNTSANPKYALA